MAKMAKRPTTSSSEFVFEELFFIRVV